MKRILCTALVMAVVLAGCGGVWVNSEYRELLDKTTAWAQVTSTRASVGDLTPENMVEALRLQALLWKDFQNASLGLDGSE